MNTVLVPVPLEEHSHEVGRNNTQHLQLANWLRGRLFPMLLQVLSTRFIVNLRNAVVGDVQGKLNVSPEDADLLLRSLLA